MSMRDKDDSDFDLEAFVDLFDTAMTSDNPAVKKAFKNLMLIAAIVNAEDKNEAICKGPMRRLVEDQKNIIRRLNDLENKNVYPGGGYITPAPMPTFPSGPNWGGPTVVPGTGTGINPWPPGTITCSTSASSTAFDDQYTPDPTAKYTAMQVLEKLEAK